MRSAKLRMIVLPFLGVLVVLALWAVSSATWAESLPSPFATWKASKLYVLDPFEKRGELDQGVARFAWYSLVLVAKGYAIALLLGAPLGFILGWSKLFSKSFDPIIQVLRPVSPLAWLPLGLVLFQKSHPAALFGHAVTELDRLRFAYLHVIEPGATDPIAKGETPDGKFFRARWRGPLIAAGVTLLAGLAVSVALYLHTRSESRDEAGAAAPVSGGPGP